ncbi:MAG: hypothetical protein K6G62_08275 [Eubacterium sp.]|nr:hypothetical protein [Eubacterium sp.]
MEMFDKFELTYWSNNEVFSIPLEKWQYFAIAQVLGLSLNKDAKGLSISCFSKETVAGRLKKMGILVTPEQYDQLKGDDNNG